MHAFKWYPRSNSSRAKFNKKCSSSQEHRRRALATRIHIVYELAWRAASTAHYCGSQTNFAGVQLQTLQITILKILKGHRTFFGPNLWFKGKISQNFSWEYPHKYVLRLAVVRIISQRNSKPKYKIQNIQYRSSLSHISWDYPSIYNVPYKTFEWN
jgi:hypothetical protein